MNDNTTNPLKRSGGEILPRGDLASTHERSEVPSLGRFGARVPAPTVAA